jgi:hypothetical protein
MDEVTAKAVEQKIAADEKFHQKRKTLTGFAFAGEEGMVPHITGKFGKN